MCRLGWAGQYGALIKRSFDIWLLEGLFPCCCFFPLGGMKQAHHKNCERARALRTCDAGTRPMIAAAGLGEFARGRRAGVRFNGQFVCELEWVTRIPCSCSKA